jgi:hypothetical protein
MANVSSKLGSKKPVLQAVPKTGSQWIFLFRKYVFHR